LLYICDLKLVERCDEMVRNEIGIVKAISSNIKMKFGLGNCARVALNSGKVYREYIGNKT